MPGARELGETALCFLTHPTLTDDEVRKTQAAIAAVKPNADWGEVHLIALKILVQGLIDQKLLRGTVDGNIESQAYQRFYMHGLGHWVGLDVHDVGDYKIGDDWRVFEPGMVTTVEPGLYIPAEGKIVDFEVMVRPMSGLQALGEEMGKRLAPYLAMMKPANS